MPEDLEKAKQSVKKAFLGVRTLADEAIENLDKARSEEEILGIVFITVEKLNKLEV